eukprot:UN02513
MDKSGLQMWHCCLTLQQPLSCSYCHHKTLKKFTFVHVYDDHVEINVPTSWLCQIQDNTRVFYLDRDWAQNFTSMKTFCGTTIIGAGSVNGTCCAGGRRIAPAMLGSHCCALLRCEVVLNRGPCAGENFAFLPCQYERVYMPFVDSSDVSDTINALRQVRERLVQQYAIVPGEPISWHPSEVQQQR